MRLTPQKRMVEPVIYRRNWKFCSIVKTQAHERMPLRFLQPSCASPFAYSGAGTLSTNQGQFLREEKGRFCFSRKIHASTTISNRLPAAAWEIIARTVMKHAVPKTYIPNAPQDR